MNEPSDPLEAELRSLRTHDLSSQTRLRVAGELEIARPAPSASPRGRTRWLVPITALVAACLLIALVLRPVPTPKPLESPLAPPQLPVTAAFDDALPTAWTYRRALIRSPLAAEDLLDKHAALAPRSLGSATPVFVRSDSELLIYGEL
jgi:hypothetical protein